MKKKKRGKKDPKREQWEAESEARLRRLRELVARGEAELAARRAADESKSI